MRERTAIVLHQTILVFLVDVCSCFGCLSGIGWRRRYYLSKWISLNAEENQQRIQSVFSRRRDALLFLICCCRCSVLICHL